MILVCQECREREQITTGDATQPGLCGRCTHNFRIEHEYQAANKQLRAEIDRLHHAADAFVPKPQQLEGRTDRKADVFALQAVAAACEYYGITPPQHVKKAMQHPAPVLSHEGETPCD